MIQNEPSREELQAELNRIKLILQIRGRNRLPEITEALNVTLQLAGLGDEDAKIDIRGLQAELRAVLAFESRILRP